MFFIGIFGIDRRHKEVKEIKDVSCKECKDGTLKLYKEYSLFHFFFLPLIKWGEEYFIFCSKCGTTYELNKEKGKNVEKGIEEINYWDLKVLKRGVIKTYCNNCHKELNEDYGFCPYCGEKI
jgi:DNA-directed RNA polymerase subunit RPC12/RpoP